MIDITDWDWAITILFLLSIVIGVMCLFSIPIVILIGLPWYFFIVKILEGVACLYFIIVGILCLFSEYPEERKTLATEVPKYWQGFLLLLLSVVFVFILLMLGERRWKFRTRILMLSEELKLAIIFGVIISIISVMVYVFPETIFLLVLGYGFFVLVTLWVSWQTPKWYVKLYTVICFFWEVFYFFYMLGSPFFGITFIFFLEIGVTLPLIPLWYLWYKGAGKQKKKESVFPLARKLKKRREELPKKREVGVVWELEDQLKELKEQLSRGVITQEEYEQKKKKLLEEHQAR